MRKNIKNLQPLILRKNPALLPINMTTRTLFHNFKNICASIAFIHWINIRIEYDRRNIIK